MAMVAVQNTLRIRVLKDSLESGVFFVGVCCSAGDPLLLDFWLQKAPFHNGQVELTDVSRQGGLGLDFVLHALHRAPNRANNHYWGPFVLALCLDALLFRFCLPAEALSGADIQDIMEERGELTLLR